MEENIKQTHVVVTICMEVETSLYAENKRRERKLFNLARYQWTNDLKLQKLSKKINKREYIIDSNLKSSLQNSPST